MKKKKKRFCVTLEYTGYDSIVIEANSEKDAKKKASLILHGMGWTEYTPTQAWKVMK